MLRIVGSLSLIAGLRFFGLFVVIPGLALYVAEQNVALAGIAVSAYAISQIIFQVPFGILDGKYSKRAVIALGLVIFIIGSLVCFFASSAEWIIVGRIIQGAGAIGSVVVAKITDLVPEEKRGKAMMFMGIAIFASFVLAMIIGSSVGVKYGVDKLFLLTAFLSFLAIIILYTIVPKAPHLHYDVDSSGTHILKNRNIMILNISVFIQKFLLTCSFTLIPLVLVRHFGIKDIWYVFSLSAAFGIFALAPGMILSEKYKKPKPVLLTAVAVFLIAYVCMGLGDTHSVMLYCGGVVLFFCAFCVHEPILQNLASKCPKMQDKSLSLGIFTTCGYVGSFCGGIVGGWVFSNMSIMFFSAIIALCVAMWFVLLLFLQNPAFAQNLYIKIQKDIDILRINALNGVIESYVNKSEGVLVVKYDAKQITKEKLEKSIEAQI